MEGRIKAVIRRLVAINIHCVENFPQRKTKREKAERPPLRKLADLIKQSEHHFYNEGGRWKCHHCHLDRSTTGLTEHLRRTLQCRPPAQDLEGVIPGLLDRPRLDLPARQRALRTLTLEGRSSHSTHNLVFYRGIYMCAACGLVASRGISYRMVAECSYKPRSHYARQNKRFLRKLKPPINFIEFPQADKTVYRIIYQYQSSHVETRKT